MNDVERRVAGEPADGMDAVDPAARYRHLPEPIDLDRTIATQETEPAPDPQGGLDTERAFMLRYGAG